MQVDAPLIEHQPEGKGEEQGKMKVELWVGEKYPMICVSIAQ
jgi:hypothetical protein